MDFIRENAKAIAGAVSTLVCLLLKPMVPAVADPAFQTPPSYLRPLEPRVILPRSIDRMRPLPACCCKGK